MRAGGGRAAALAALTATIVGGRLLEDALEEPLAELPDDRERALARELAYGSCRFWFRLAALRDHLLERPLRRRDADVGVLLVLGLYQLVYSRIPAHAAVEQTVSLSSHLGKGWARGLVNAVLRRFSRDQRSWLADTDAHEAARLAHPDWLLDALRHAWPDAWPDVVAANNAQGPMTLRVNRRRASRDGVLGELAAAGVGAAPCQWSPEGVRLDAARDVARLPGFAEGRVSVQDEASQLAAALLAPAPGMRVLDACAAPGGKLAHLLEGTPGLAGAVAVERDAARLARLQGTLSRLGLDGEAQVLRGDATDPGAWWDGSPFERILLDAPCTATGVIRRHPDIKLRRRPGDATARGLLQSQLLDALWPLLAAGGRLLYATCSVMPEENTAPLSRFLAAHADAAALDMKVAWGRAAPPGRQVLPGEAGMDGFYYALLAKR
jgi:16S rRNA (cytosine967-C5)-methyltransferase